MTELLEFECSSSSEDKDEVLARFCQALKSVQTRHSNVVQAMAQGVLELRDSHTVDKQTDMAIQYFLDRFYMSRISIRMLIHQVTTKGRQSKKSRSLSFHSTPCCSQHYLSLAHPVILNTIYS